jgi:hypothetical protein
VPSSVDVSLDELVRLASTAAARKGHNVRDWTADPPGSEDARRGTCSRCGRTLYVRVGAGMTGMAGTALTEPCD